MQDALHLAESNIFQIIFWKGQKRHEDLSVILSLIMSNKDFDPVRFIIEVDIESSKQVTCIAKEEGKIFTMAIGAIQERLASDLGQSLRVNFKFLLP